MLVVAPDSELGALSDILLPSPTCSPGIVHPDIQHEHPAFILAVVTAHVCQRPVGFHYDRDPVQLRVTRVKNVTGQWG